AFAQARESLHVTEHHGHHAALAFGGGQCWSIDQSLHDFRVDISTESFPDTLVVAQSLDHPVESGRQLSDLVAGCDAYRSIETARFDRACALQQSLDWSGDAAANEDREN